MAIFGKSYQKNDFIAQKRKIEEEGRFQLKFAGIQFVASTTFEYNGEEQNRPARIEMDFVTDTGEFATVRYPEFRFQQCKNLLEYMFDNEYLRGFDEGFTAEAWEAMTFEARATFVNGLQKSSKKLIGVVVEEHTSANGNQYFSYDIDQDVKNAVDIHQAQAMVEPPEVELSEPADEDLPF